MATIGRDSGGVRTARHCNLLSTPKGSAAGPDYAKINRSKTGVSLQTVVGLLPTPSTKDVSGGAVEAIPTATGFKRVSKQGVSHGAQLHDVMKTVGTNLGLKLQPAFVEGMMGYPNGSFGWADVAVPDTAQAKEFYTGLFGWEAIHNMFCAVMVKLSMCLFVAFVHFNVMGFGCFTAWYNYQNIPFCNPNHFSNSLFPFNCR